MREPRKRITVFGNRYQLLDVFDNVADQPLVLYRNYDDGKNWKPKVCTLQDWQQWDENSRRKK